MAQIKDFFLGKTKGYLTDEEVQAHENKGQFLTDEDIRAREKPQKFLTDTDILKHDVKTKGVPAAKEGIKRVIAGPAAPFIGPITQKVKQLIHEGNIRRLRVIHDGDTVLEIPLTIGASAAAVSILIAPLLAALGAFAALVTECTIEVEKVEK